jgi:hypothetical protein
MCQFGDVEKSMIRYHTVVDMFDDATQRKLLQMRDLTLAETVDICKVNDQAAGRTAAESDVGDCGRPAFVAQKTIDGAAA